MEEENRFFFLCSPMKAKNIHILWHQKLLKAHKGQNFPQTGKKLSHICPMKHSWKSELQHQRRTGSKSKFPEWLARLLLCWPTQKTVSWRDQDLSSYCKFKDLFLCFGLYSKMHPAENSSSQKHKAFLLVGEAIWELCHRGIYQRSESKAAVKARGMIIVSK